MPACAHVVQALAINSAVVPIQSKPSLGIVFTFWFPSVHMRSHRTCYSGKSSYDGEIAHSILPSTCTAYLSRRYTPTRTLHLSIGRIP